MVFLNARLIYASPDGLSTNTGDIDSPYDIATGFASVSSGNTLYLRAGTYSGNRILTLYNTGAIIRSYPGERAIINGQVTVYGDFVRLIGLEITNNTNRDRSAAVGTVGLDLQGSNIEVINCVIHDHDQGLTTSAVRNNHIYYGNVFYHNGYDSALGHGLYPQNLAGNSKTIKRNIVFNNFGYGIHCYGSGGDVSSFVIDGNTVFRNGVLRDYLQRDILNGGSAGLTGPVLRNNCTYKTTGEGDDKSAQIGYGSDNVALDVSVYDNYFVSFGAALNLVDCTLTRFDGNTLIGTLSGAALGDNTQLEDFPTSDSHVVLTSNEYDADRAQLTIYNWGAANTITVDVSSIYSDSDRINARNVQDYFTDVQELTVADGNIVVNMQAVNRTVAAPVGWDAPATTFPQFGCFVLEKA